MHSICLHNGIGDFEMTPIPQQNLQCAADSDASAVSYDFIASCRNEGSRSFNLSGGTGSPCLIADESIPILLNVYAGDYRSHKCVRLSVRPEQTQKSANDFTRGSLCFWLSSCCLGICELLSLHVRLTIEPGLRPHCFCERNPL